MQRTQIYLPKSQLDSLRSMALRRSTTVSHLMRAIVDEKLHARPQAKHHETLVEAARRINKLGKPGPKDLAINMDYYLYATPKRY